MTPSRRLSESNEIEKTVLGRAGRSGSATCVRRPYLDSRLTRRRFLTLAGAACALPAVIPSDAPGAVAPSERIVLGVVGCGNMGTTNTQAFLKQKGCQVVAACDVDKEHLARAVALVNRHYQDQGCKPYLDFRELIARSDIDAVMLAVPDHWHELVAVEAARHRKDIYGEKPLAHTIAEQQAMVKAARENHCIWQTGSWQRSLAIFRKAAEIVRNGLIGDVTHVEVGLPDGNRNSGNEARSMTPSDPPPELDYGIRVDKYHEIAEEFPFGQ